MARLICDFEDCLCVNNYRGNEYHKPNTGVECKDCILNPKNHDKRRDISDMDRVISNEKIRTTHQASRSCTGKKRY